MVTIMKIKMMKILEVLSKPLNIRTHCEALETSFQMLPLAFRLRQFGGKCLIFSQNALSP
jgi:hypothetical protein